MDECSIYFKLSLQDIRTSSSTTNHVNKTNTSTMPKTMNIFPKKKKRFQMSYKAKEVDMYEKLEETLMEDLCIPTRSDLHKYCIRTVHNLRSAAALNIA